MSIKNWPGGRISSVPPTPSGPYENSTASGVWTLDQQAYWEAQNLWPTAGNIAPDPDFEYVTMLLHGDGTNGAQNNTFLDSSTNNFTITRNGNTTQGSFSPYGPNWSNFFDGTGDYLSTTGSYSLSGNFTYESFIYFLGNNARPFSIGDTGTNPSTSLDIYISPAGTVAIDGSRIFASVALNANAWNHIALVRNSGTYTLYINGVSAGTASFSGTLSGTTYVGASSFGGTIYAGDAAYYSSTRVTTSAVYTANFTPSTTPLTAISGTVLLTCADNRFIDESTNNFTFTVNGNPSVQRFSPFAPPAAYNPATIGGSGYFDGSGDFLGNSSSTAIQFGTGDFSVEFWFYIPSAFSGDTMIVEAQPTGGAFQIYYSTGVGYWVWGTFGGGLSVNIGGSSTFQVGAWNHLAVCRVGTTYSSYINGARTATGTNSTNFSISEFYVGGRSGGSQSLRGYLASVRCVKGASAYTPSNTTITVPTAPLTAITNTSLLLGFTNGAIFDNAMMNDLETVGNAQISTSVVKFGTGSMAFDGATDVVFGAASPVNRLDADFTVECWAYPLTQIDFYPSLFTIGQQFTGTSKNIIVYFNHASDPNVYSVYVNDTRLFAGTITPSLNTWNFFSLTRSGNTWRMFVNGVLDASATRSGVVFTASPPVSIGGESPVRGSTWFTGYIDDFRITNGVARYTANFTPPAAAFPNQ